MNLSRQPPPSNLRLNADAYAGMLLLCISFVSVHNPNPAALKRFAVARAVPEFAVHDSCSPGQSRPGGRIYGHSGKPFGVALVFFFCTCVSAFGWFLVESERICAALYRDTASLLFWRCFSGNSVQCNAKQCPAGGELWLRQHFQRARKVKC